MPRSQPNPNKVALLFGRGAAVTSRARLSPSFNAPALVGQGYRVR